MKLKIVLLFLVGSIIFFSCKKEVPTGPKENKLPELAPISDQTVYAGQTVNVSISATDQDGDSLSFSIPANPGFLSITGAAQSGNTATATLVIAPQANNVGTFDASVKVSDGRAGEDREDFKVNVLGVAEGKWLEYWSGAQPARLQLGSVQYYCVRFTRPSDWSNLSIDKVKIVFASDGQTIRLCFWKDYQYQSGDYWPSGSPSKGPNATISYGGNTWDTPSLGWTTSNNEFFVGIEQVSSTATLCGDGKCQPENRSYRCETGKSWVKEYGMMANYCISVYVTKK